MDYDKYFSDLQSQMNKELEESRKTMEQELGVLNSAYTNYVQRENTSSSDNKFCPECGASTMAKAMFCPMCGYKFQNDDDEQYDNAHDTSSDELNECPVDWENFEGCGFTYSYESDGEECEVEVTYELSENEDGDEEYCWCSDEGIIDIDDEDFRGCEDINDCGVVIAKRVIHDNDGEVRMSFGRGELTFTDQPCAIVLDKELNYLTESEETVRLTLYANQGCDVMSTNFYELDEEAFENIKELLNQGETDDIWEHLDSEFFCNETFNLVGDEESERLSYEITDSEGDVIDEGDICVTAENVFRYSDIEDNFAVSREYHPQYLLVTTESVKRSYAEFEMPDHFSIGGISFIENENVERRIINCDYFGDKATSITQIRYAGQTYYCDDMGDAGTLGDYSYLLYEWDEDDERYILVAN